jgi:tetratricopeptide (TPR) repeat protein
MKRVWSAVVAAGIVIVLAVTAGNALVREREYQAFLARGDAAVAAGQTFQAIEAYSGAIALRGDSMIAHLKRGEVYRQRGENGAALRDLRTAERLDPSAARPAELLGDVNYELERYARAVESYRACAALDDRSPRVLYKLGLALFRSGDAAGAQVSLRQAIALDAKLPEAHYVLGLCLTDTRQPREAVAAFETAIRLDPGLIAAREELAAGYAAAGQTRQAVEQLEALAALEPERPERQAVVALAWARGGRTNDSVNLLGRAAARYPDHTSVFLALGRIWLDAAEPRRDRMALRKALAALQPLAGRPTASSEALALYGRALMLSGNVNEAETFLRQASETFPVRMEALSWHADAAERIGRLAAARQSLERWITLAPESTADQGAVLERIGALGLRLGDTAGAAAALLRATEAPSRRSSAFSALANLQLTVGQRDAASGTVSRGLEVFPQDAALLSMARRLR